MSVSTERRGRSVGLALGGGGARGLAHIGVTVPEEVKEKRLERFMAVQTKISAVKLQRKIGSDLTVLVDALDNGRAIARSAADAPEIDGLVYVEDGGDLPVGEFARVTVVDADEHDLYARRRV